jgi:thiol-disulfide isomerase/thioredoxin
MKRILISIFALILSVLAYSQAKPKVIVNPSYEVKNSGIYNVAQIELSDNQTRLTIHCTYVPYWFLWFQNKEVLLRDQGTGKSYELKGMEGAEMEKQIWMKGSGDSTIVLIYPPLDKTVKKIDFGNWVYGVSLDESEAGKRGPSTVPAQVTKWIDQELAKLKRKAPIDFYSQQFFNNGTARLIGYIKGYDTRLGFTTGLVYSSNELTREDFPSVVQIHPDGRFEVDLPYSFPKYSMMYINDMGLPFYLEPGQTLSMIVDWEEFLIADRRRNIRYQIQDVIYQGPLAKINSELAGCTSEQFDYEGFRTKKSTISPEAFKNSQLPVSKAKLQKVEEYISTNTLTPQAACILRNKTLLEESEHLLDFVSDRRYFASQDTANKMLKIPVPIAYYDFLKEMPLNDNCLLVSGEFASFVNRFEYCEPLMHAKKTNVIKHTKPEKDYLTYLIDEGVEISAEDKVLANMMMKENRSKDEDSIMKSKKVEIQAFLEKNKDHIQGYSEKYIKPMQKTGMANYYQEDWKAKDSVLRSDLGLENSLVYEITKIRSLKYIFDASSREAAKGFWDELKTGITHPYLIETGNQLLETTFPAEKLAAYTLPKGSATDVFRKITDQFKGKILFVDFWATTCGPCVGGIKTMKPNRERYKDSKDFEFIFITDERGSPKDAYDKFVAEQEMKNTYRLSKDDYNYLRQLFKFNGIPHYTVIDKAGNVLNNNFPMHNFESELKVILSNK